MTANLPAKKTKFDDFAVNANEDFVTMMISDQLFGIPVLKVQDVLGHQRITRIPLAPPEVAGSLNLRGRIVTAIDVLCGSGCRPFQGQAGHEHRGRSAGRAVQPDGRWRGRGAEPVVGRFRAQPVNLDVAVARAWTGIYRLNGTLLVVLDVSRLLNFANLEAV